MEDFEFRPLTEGLGFHKKAMELKEDVVKNIPSQTGILPKPKNTPASFQMPLTQTPAQPQKAVVWNQSTKQSTFLEKPKAPIAKPTLMEEPLVTQYEPVSFSWSAAVFDAAMISGMSLLFSAVVFALTKVELNTVYESLISDSGVQLATLLILFAVFEIYTVTCRTFFAKTLGEWVFDVRLGAPKEQMSFFYPFKVALRTFFVTITGFFLLPVLSSAFGLDIAGALTGVRLMSEKR